MKGIKTDLVLLLFCLSILAATTSLIGGITAAIIYLTTVLLIVNRDGSSSFHRRPFVLSVLFYIVVILYSAFGRGTLNSVSFKTEFYSIIVVLSCFIMSFHVKIFKADQIRVLFVFSLLCILYSVIATTLVGLINPMAIRQYGFGEVIGVEVSELSRYRSSGMMSYSLAHAMAVVSLGLSAVVCYSNKPWIRVFSGILLLLIIRLLFIMTITTALLLSSIGISVVFADYLSGGRVVLGIFLSILFMTLFFATGVASIFLDFSQGVNMQISAKLADVFSFLESGSGEGQLGYRQELYSASFKTFLHNPLFGWGVDNGSRTKIGEHSFLLDYLAYYGVLALLLFAAWWIEYKSLGSKLSNTLRNPYFISFIPVIGLCSLKAHSVCSSLPFFALVFLQIVFTYLNDNLQTSNHIKRKR